MVEFLCFCFPFCLPVHFTPIRLFGNVKQQRHLAFFFHIFLKKAWCHFGTYQNCKKRKVELPIRICIDMVEIFLKSPNVQPKVEIFYVIYWVVYKSSLVHSTDYGRSMNLFFSLKSRPFGFGQINWPDKFWGISGILGRIIRTNLCTV